MANAEEEPVDDNEGKFFEIFGYGSRMLQSKNNLTLGNAEKE